MEPYTVSIIITTCNEEGNIENCLNSIKKQDYPADKIEILVVDNNSSDRTKEIAGKYTEKIYNFGPERSAQRNLGILRSSGKYILYLDADMILSEGVLAECINKCDREDCIALYIPERIMGKGFWMKVRDFERSFYNATCIDAVRFVRRDIFQEAPCPKGWASVPLSAGVSGFDENLTGPEDWDLDRRIKHLGKAGIIKSPIYHHEADLNFKKYIDKKNYYAQWFEAYIRKWGRNDSQIKRQFGFWYRYFGVFFEHGKWLRLIRHPFLTAGMYWLRVTVGWSYILKTGKNGKKGILILTPFFSPNIGGVESYLDDLCAHLRTHGYMVYVLTYKPLTARIQAKSFEVADNLEIRRIPWVGYNLFHRLEPYPVLEFLYLTPWLFIHTFLLLLRKRTRINVLHAQGLNAAFITRLLAPLFRKRAVISTCAVYNLDGKSFFSRVVRWVLSGMDKVLPLGSFSKRELLRIGLPEAKLKTYHLWIDQRKYIPADKQESKARVNLQGKFVVLFVGRFIKIKGAEVLLEAAQRANENIQFVFIGDEGPLLQRIESESRHCKNIALIRGVFGLQLIPYYQAADIVVVPSQYDEAFGKVIIEAFSCGTPVIGSNKGAIPDIVSSLVGRVVEPTAGEIGREIEYLYCHPEILSVLTHNCRSYAQEHFDEKNIKVVTDSYNS